MTNRPIISPEHLAIQNLLHTTQHIRNQFSQLFHEHDLTHSQYTLLQHLLSAGQPLTTQEVAHLMQLGKSSMTGILTRLQGKRLISRKHCSNDQRIIYVEPTDSVGELLDHLEVPVNELHMQLVEHLTLSETNQLTHLLVKMLGPRIHT